MNDNYHSLRDGYDLCGGFVKLAQSNMFPFQMPKKPKTKKIPSEPLTQEDKSRVTTEKEAKATEDGSQLENGIQSSNGTPTLSAEQKVILSWILEYALSHYNKDLIEGNHCIFIIFFHR